MLRLGNTKSAAKDSSEPLLRLQKNTMKFSLGAINMLNLEAGSYVDIGLHEGSFWLAVTGTEDADSNKPKGKKVGRSNAFSSSAILGQLRGEHSEDDKVAYRITEETLEMFGETWHRMVLDGEEAVTSRTSAVVEEEVVEEAADNELLEENDYI